MTPDDFYGMSWIAVRSSDVEQLLRTVGLEPIDESTLQTRGTGTGSLAAACQASGESVVCVPAGEWTYLFGYQVGLGGYAADVSESGKRVLSFENGQKQGTVLCAIYEDGSTMRQVSYLQGDFATEGSAIGDEPPLEETLDDETVIALSRAWGADPTALEEGDRVIVVRQVTNDASSPGVIAVVVLLVVIAILLFVFL